MLSSRGFKNFAARCRKLAKQTRQLLPDARSQIQGSDAILIKNLAEYYFRQVKENLYAGKYEKGHQYNPRYAEWKIENYGHLEPWFLEGDLARSIQVFKRDGVRGVGPPPGKKAGGKSWLYSRSGQRKSYNPREIAKYGASVEDKFPLFGPALQEFMTRDGRRLTIEATHTVLKKWEIR